MNDSCAKAYESYAKQLRAVVLALFPSVFIPSAFFRAFITNFERPCEQTILTPGGSKPSEELS